MYPYTSHLLAFNSRINPMAPPSWLQGVSTPLVLREWARDWPTHPDQAFRGYILDGIEHGFWVGLNYDSLTCVSTSSNSRSASRMPAAQGGGGLPRQRSETWSGDWTDTSISFVCPEKHSGQPHWGDSQATSAREVEADCELACVHIRTTLQLAGIVSSDTTLPVL